MRIFIVCAPFLCADIRRVAAFTGRLGIEYLQRGSGRLIKSNVAPKLCDHWHNFICSPVADGAKNNCDFAGFDLNGDLHNKSSHAPVKTAMIILLSFRFPTCITSQVKLFGNLGNDSVFIFKEPLASFARHAACCGPGFPGPRFRFTVLPVEPRGDERCRHRRHFCECPADTSMRCSPAGA